MQYDKTYILSSLNFFLKSFSKQYKLIHLFILIVFITISLVTLDYCFPVSLNPTQQQFARVITADDGTPLRTFADKNGIWRYPISINQVSPKYIQALITYEDRWFWHHPGINIFSITRAIIQNIQHSKVISGGSTLTMQVARLLSPHNKTVLGKAKQMFVALQLEWHNSKEEILNYYLNHAPFGGRIEGVQAASYTYLGKSAQELSHAEAALLTVLPQAPSRNRPDKYPERALIARNKVIKRMQEFAIWTEQTVDQALLEPIIVTRKKTPNIAPLLARRLKNSLAKKQVIKTTIDFSMQKGIEELVKDYIDQLPQKTSAAVLVMDNKTLSAKSYIGSADFFNSERFGHIDMVRAIRSPGSTLKPFLYGIALDKGIVHSESLLIDAPLSFDGYKPQNFSRRFTGAVSVKNALIRSLNIPAVQVLHQLESEVFVSSLKNSGLTLRFNNHAKSNLSVVLGGVGSNLESLVSTYSALANGGKTAGIHYVKDSSPAVRYLFSAGAAWIIQDILSHHNIPAPYNLAWKTGTSYGHRDFWSIGVTPDYTIGVWIGRPDGTPLPGHYGAHTASPLLFSIAERFNFTKIINKPETVKSRKICWPLGGAKNETPEHLCHQTKLAWILDNQVPLTLPEPNKSSWQSNPVTIQVDSNTGLILNQSCQTDNAVEKQVAFWPLATEPWLARQYKRSALIGTFDSSCSKAVVYGINEIKIEGIDNYTKLRSAGASKKLPRIKLQAIGGQGKYYWFINAKLSYTVNLNNITYHQFKEPGHYQLTVIDDSGHSDSVNIEVL